MSSAANPPSNRLRFGVAGLGWAAREFHLPALKALASIELVGGSDLSAEQRARWQAESGTPAYETLAELIERQQPDVLIVATPPAAHAPVCLEALAAGIHVVCEKPFVSNLAEADEVLAAARAAGRHVAVNHEFRRMPIFRAVEKRIGSRQAGSLTFCQIWQLMDLAPWDEPVAWRAAMPNRTLFEGGVHLVDLMLMLFGSPPDAVYARHSSGIARDREADAIHLVTLEFPGQRLGLISIDRLCPAGTRYAELRADCERESLRASIGGRAMLHIGRRRAERSGIRLELGVGGMAWAERGLRRRTLSRNPGDAGPRATATLLGDIVEALIAGREPPSSGREARIGLAVIEAAYRSAHTGTRVELDWEADSAAGQPARALET